MPFNKMSPGVYVEEVSGGPRPIESVATAILAMVGFCRDSWQVPMPGSKNGETQTQQAPVGPQLVTNWEQFATLYGGLDQAIEGYYLHKSMWGFFQNGGKQAYVVGLPVKTNGHAPAGGAGTASAGRQLMGDQKTLKNEAGADVLQLMTGSDARADEPIAVEVQAPTPDDKAPDNSVILSIKRGGGGEQRVPVTVTKSGKAARVSDLATDTKNLLQVKLLGDLTQSVPLTDFLPMAGQMITLTARQQAMAAPGKPAAIGMVIGKDQMTADRAEGDTAERSGVHGLEAIDEVTLLAFPDLMAALQTGLFTEDEVKRVQQGMIDHCEKMQDRFAILDCPPGMNAQQMLDWRKRMAFDSSYAALYYPWIQVGSKPDKTPDYVPPSGHVAGVYGRVDDARGVHKAPANERLRGVIGLERNVTVGEQDLLNPESINCIRLFANQGIRIWGARTLSSDAEWRYINVRRLFANLEESILDSTSWTVFEPNDEFLWRAIRRDITAYLTVVWRSGALFGNTAEQAFFVKCDETNNTQEMRDLGYCIIDVGIAPVKPAEFVVFRVQQKQDGAGSTSE